MKFFFLTLALALFPLWGEWVPENGWLGDESITNQSLIKSRKTERVTPVYGNPLSFALYQALKLYQNKLYQAPVNGSKPGRCPFYPTCSRFALEALGAHGPLWGSLMTADRLFIREHQDLSRHYECVDLNGDTRFADPVEINFIFRKCGTALTLF